MRSAAFSATASTVAFSGALGDDRQPAPTMM